ncbi:hypothetical protein O5584_24060 [Escherichia coli]|nr:hypothetical protein [Escherichia coli]
MSNTGLATVTIGTTVGGQRLPIAVNHAAGKNRLPNIIAVLFFLIVCFPKNYPARSPRFPASE